MPPKKSSNKPKKTRKKSRKGRRKKVDKNLQFCDDKHFDPKLAVVTVEHCLRCPIYREMAEKIFADISDTFPDHKFKLIRNGFDRLEAREGSFELSLAKNCRSPAQLLWSGIERGPPRREKFPLDLTSIIERVDKELNSEQNILAFLTK
ncbi:selenoprotein H-like [Ochlerotatus camptorhynchus]|uniref:selenoprotein H-like n=1 Tax=Ochlerotatus camptorhynchus TaxID=644619 RepID=UPI0031D83E56